MHQRCGEDRSPGVGITGGMARCGRPCIVQCCPAAGAQKLWCGDVISSTLIARVGLLDVVNPCFCRRAASLGQCAAATCTTTPASARNRLQQWHQQWQLPDTRVQGHTDTRAHRHKGTLTQGYNDTIKDTRTQGHKDTRTHGHEDTRTQGHKDTRAQQDTARRVQCRKGSSLVSDSPGWYASSLTYKPLQGSYMPSGHSEVGPC